MKGLVKVWWTFAYILEIVIGIWIHDNAPDYYPEMFNQKKARKQKLNSKWAPLTASILIERTEFKFQKNN